MNTENHQIQLSKYTEDRRKITIFTKMHHFFLTSAQDKPDKILLFYSSYITFPSGAPWENPIVFLSHSICSVDTVVSESHTYSVGLLDQLWRRVWFPLPEGQPFHCYIHSFWNLTNGIKDWGEGGEGI